MQRQLNHAGDIIKEEKKKRIKKENSSENWAVGFWLMAIFAALCFVVASNAVGFWTPTIEIFISLVIVIIGGIILITVGNAITSNPIGTAYSVAGFGLLGFVAWLILR